MLEMFKGMLPAWAWTLILCVVACVGTGFTLWAQTHDPVAVVIGLAAVIVGPGLAGLYGIGGKPPTPPPTPPPTTPTATAPVTP